MGPSLRTGPYALLNARHGYFLGQRQPTSKHPHPVVRPLGSDSHKDVFVVEIGSTDGSSATVAMLRLVDGEYLSISNAKDGAKLSGDGQSNGIPTTPDDWKVGWEGNGGHAGFYRVKNLSTGTFLDYSDDSDVDSHGNHYAVGNSRSDSQESHSQLWHFVEIEANQTDTEIHNAMLSARHRARNGLAAAQAPGWNPSAYAGGQVQYTGPNLCGVPTCGVDHICNDDYNRIVRPMGYPGVG